MPFKRRVLLAIWFVGAIGQPAFAQWRNTGPATPTDSLAFGSDGALYAGSDQGVYRRNPTTLQWEARSAGISDLGIAALVADPTAPGTLYAIGGGGSNHLPGGVFKTTDGGLTWTAAGSGLRLVERLALDPSNPATVYAGTQVGLYKSVDGGAHWAPVNSGLTNNSIWSIAIDPTVTSTVYVGTTDGVFKSMDGGASWNAASTGLGGITHTVTASAFAIDPTKTSTIYLASFYPFSLPSGNGVYKSTDGGGTWAQTNNGVTAGSMSAVALDPHSPSTVYAAGLKGPATAKAFRTTDGGASWTDISGGLAYPAGALAVDPNVPGTVYAATRGGVFELSPGATCASSADTLCLNGSRFKVQVSWRVPSQGTSGAGQAIPMTSDTGAFWFFSSGNVEVVVKVLDGRAFNNYFWVFCGALSNVEFTITVTDTQSGTVKNYFNQSGQQASFADTAAFSP